MDSNSTSSFQPTVEGLEDRNLLAAQLTASLSNGLLRIEGTDADDSIVVRQIHDRISIDHVQIDQSDQSPTDSVAASEVDRFEIRGLGGDDKIWLNSGDVSGQDPLMQKVTVWAGTGNDQVWGNNGESILYGQAGHDILFGGGGNDLLSGSSGQDYLKGGSGDDELLGGSGDDVIYGGTGDDHLEGGRGTNALYGNDGIDALFSMSSSDRIDGGHNDDTLHLLDDASANSQAMQIYGTETIHGESTQQDVNPEPTQENQTTVVTVPEVEVKPEPEPVVVEESIPEPSIAPQTAIDIDFGAFASEEREVLELLNEYRTENGLRALRLNSDLMDAAKYQAEYMAQTEHYSHVNLDGTTLTDRVQDTGYAYHWVAENAHKYDPESGRTVGVSHFYSRSEISDYFMDGWKQSPGHNGSMLSTRAEEIGIAIAQSASGNIYAVQVFGDPRK